MTTTTNTFKKCGENEFPTVSTSNYNTLTPDTTCNSPRRYLKLTDDANKQNSSPNLQPRESLTKSIQGISTVKTVNSQSTTIMFSFTTKNTIRIFISARSSIQLRFKGKISRVNLGHRRRKGESIRTKSIGNLRPICRKTFISGKLCVIGSISINSRVNSSFREK